ncbi:MAG: serine hydrolase [Pseudomonadota bacterium]
MATALRVGGAALLVVALSVAYWYFRPGSEFSPAEVIRASGVDDRRESYRHMDEVYPSSPIIRPRQVTTFERDLVDDLEPTWVWMGQDRNLEQYLEQRSVQGLYVLKDGKVRFERYYGDAGPEDHFTSWSVAKSWVSTLIAIGMRDGKISGLDDLVSDYAPEYVGTDYGDTSIRDLLNMSSGIQFNENYEEPGADIRKLFFNTFLMNRDVDNTVRQFARFRPAGEHFNYISTNTQVLSAVLRGAYGMPLIDIVNEELSTPLGLSGGYWLTDRKGKDKKELGYCCLQLTLEDYAKLGQLYVQEGMLGDQRILPEGWIEAVRTVPQESHSMDNPRRLGYSLHFWLLADMPGAFAMQGYDGQYIAMDPDNDLVIVMVSADRTMDYSQPAEHPLLFSAIREELRRIDN